MIRRLFMALLLIGLALPALAAPIRHEAMAGHALVMAMDHGARHGPPAAPTLPGDKAKHECIGCIAAFDTPFLAAVPFLHRAAPAPDRSSALPSARAGPETPPPKS